MSGTYQGQPFNNTLKLARERIEQPSLSRTNQPIPYEHHVGTWAMTMVIRHFQDLYLVTPEKHDSNTNKKPDITIEIYDPEEPDYSRVHAVYELKKKEGDVFEKILDQLKTAIYESADIDQNFEIFALAQRGMEIGFFEYFSYGNLLDGDDIDDDDVIENFRCFVPITLKNNRLVCQSPEDEESREKVDNLLENMSTEKKGKMKHLVDRTVRGGNIFTKEAQKVKTQCVFNLNRHEEEIDFLFNHLATTLPRKIRDDE